MYRSHYPDAPGHHNMDSHTRVSYRRNPGFLERIGQSLIGVLVGIALLIGASVLLFWNEGRAVKTAKSLDEGLSKVKVQENIFGINTNNDGALIYITGELSTGKQPLVDDLHYVTVNAVKLQRTVEMYQWVETETKREYNEGGQTRTETTYSYDLEWRSNLVNSDSFDNPVGHKNSRNFPVESKTQVASPVHVGIYHLSSGLVDQINDFHPIPSELLPVPHDGYVVFNGMYYMSQNPRKPQAGDIRVSYKYAGISGESTLGKPDVVSIIGKQSGNSIVLYEADHGYDLLFLYMGRHSPEAIFSKEQQKNTMISWAVRFGGWLLMFVGFGCLTSIIRTLVDWLPIIRELVAIGVTMMNLCLSISLSLTVIAIGWIAYRPLMGIAILAMAAMPFFMAKFRSRGSHGHTSYD
ncbi:transmembrane protein 43-like [Saccostrea cucullata]|uniref:transmembrane protein 43-like n=1 Tax=Saccostrea cuccullata TaxID=36930 RepID=UPI002ED61B76